MIQLASYPNFNCNCQNQISIPAIIASTVEYPNFGIKDTWDQYKFKWFVPCIEIVLFKRFQSHYIDRGDKIWGFSFVHCREIFNTVPLSRRVLFERLQCIYHKLCTVKPLIGVQTW